jgi:glycosyltransferase involved in cell wall biosynthesis
MVLSHPDDEFIFFFDRPYSDDFIFAENVRPVVLYPPARHPVLFFLWFEIAVAYALKKHRCDVFFSPDSFLSLGTSVPTAIVSHDLAYLHRPNDVSGLVKRYYQYFSPRFHEKASHIFAVSNYTRQDILTQYPSVLPSKVSVAYNACDENLYFPLTIADKNAVKAQFSQGKPYFLYVGSVHPRKNLLNLLKAFELFKQNNLESDLLLVIAGRIAWQTGEMTNFYEKMAARESVKFLEFVPQGDLTRLIAASFALCYVSLFEGFGIPILEAMHCETPVITSNCSSMPEVAGDAALLINPYNPQDISDGLTRLYRDETLRATLIEKGKVRRQTFSWDESTRHIWEVLKTL